MAFYSIDVKIYGTLYIKAESEAEAQKIAVEATTGYGEVQISGDDSDVCDVCEFLEVATIHPLEPGDKVELFSDE